MGTISVILSNNFKDLVRNILTKMTRNFTGQTFARIAVEVGEEEDVKLLVESKTVDWNQRAEGEDPAVFWALNNERFEMVKILLKCPDLDLGLRSCQGHSLEKVARDRFLDGQEEYREILEFIPGTVEYVNKVQAEVNRQNQLEMRQIKNMIDQCVKKVRICINLTLRRKRKTLSGTLY